VEQHVEHDAAMTTLQAKKATQKMDKRFCDKNSTAKPASPVAGGTRREDSTVKKDDDDDEDATSKPDSPGAGVRDATTEL
jgi:hypothetical protein